jgi:acyl-CoA thioesterase
MAPSFPTIQDVAPMPFADLMRLEKLNKLDGHDRYQSTELPFTPGLGNRAFGGHVYAQAVWAASQTVNDEGRGGFVVHVCMFVLFFVWMDRGEMGFKR